MSDKLIIGNIITVNKNNPFAKAVAVKDGHIVYVGDVDKAKMYVDSNVEVLDYKNNYVYPGFLESHTHGLLAGYRAIGQADVSQVIPTNYDTYKKIIKKYIEDNPDKDVYVAAGWEENETYITSKYLDEICSEKPLVLNTGGGHSCLLNTKALEICEIDSKFAKEAGYDLVHVDEQGNPDGYICEGPAIELMKYLPMTFEDVKKYILKWQDIMLSKGFTAVCDAGINLIYSDAAKIYNILERDNKLKLRTYAYVVVNDNPKNPKKEIEKIYDEDMQYSGEYLKIIGAKVFLDGVTEAHTSWLIDDYNDEPGYHGIERFNDKQKMIDLITCASLKGYSVHAHSEGDGATKFMLECIEESIKFTGNLDQRNQIAHLHYASSHLAKKIAETHSIAVVPPLWVAKISGEYDNELAYVGEARALKAYPIKLFIDEGALITYHSDYPVSPIVDIPRSIYMAEMRAVPEKEYGGLKTQRGIEESVGRVESLLAMTKNVAFAWGQEDRMGSLEVGKLANMAVFDKDFLNNSIEDVAKSKCIATIIDGQEVYKNSN